MEECERRPFRRVFPYVLEVCGPSCPEAFAQTAPEIREKNVKIRITSETDHNIVREWD